MTRDWKRLAATIRAARGALALTQVELAQRAGASESTVQLIESGDERKRLPRRLPAVERALGWAPGSAVNVLGGGEPTPLPEGATSAQESPSRPMAAVDDLADGMPHLARQELKAGRVIDARVVDLSEPGSRSKLIVVWKRDDESSDVPITAEEIKEWTRVQRQIRGLPTPSGE